MESPLQYFFFSRAATSSARRVRFWLNRALRDRPKTGFDRCSSFPTLVWSSEIARSHVTPTPTSLSTLLAFCCRHFETLRSRGSVLFCCVFLGLHFTSVAISWLADLFVASLVSGPRLLGIRSLSIPLTFSFVCCPAEQQSTTGYPTRFI